MVLPACTDHAPTARTVRLSITAVDADSGATIPDAACNGGPCDTIQIPVDQVVAIAITAPGYGTTVRPYRIQQATETAVGLRRAPEQP